MSGSPVPSLHGQNKGLVRKRTRHLLVSTTTSLHLKSPRHQVQLCLLLSKKEKKTKTPVHYLDTGVYSFVLFQMSTKPFCPVRNNTSIRRQKNLLLLLDKVCSFSTSSTMFSKERDDSFLKHGHWSHLFALSLKESP